MSYLKNPASEPLRGSLCQSPGLCLEKVEYVPSGKFRYEYFSLFDLYFFFQILKLSQKDEEFSHRELERSVVGVICQIRFVLPQSVRGDDPFKVIPGE